MAKKTEKEQNTKTEVEEIITKNEKADSNIGTCGIVMPISKIGDYSAEHWQDVLQIIQEAIFDTNLKCDLVSNSDDSGIIQKRIVQNLYSNDVVICDVSAKNPNVMFELGMRLAFDKPTIIIKDDATDYSFDTAPIEHISYPRDLRYTEINKFKTILKNKVLGTLEASRKSDYTTFLKHFGEFKVAHIEEKEISSEQYMIKALNDIQKQLGRLEKDKYLSALMDELSDNDIEYKKNTNFNELREYPLSKYQRYRYKIIPDEQNTENMRKYMENIGKEIKSNKTLDFPLDEKNDENIDS